MKVPDWIEAPGDLPMLETAIEIAEETAGALDRAKQYPIDDRCIYLPCEAAQAITRLIREARQWRRLREDSPMPEPVSLGGVMAACSHRIAVDAVDAAEQGAAMTREKLLEVAEVGFEADGLKVIERIIESIPPEEIAALRERLRAEGKLERRTIKAVIRTGEG